jgi:NAD(P)-dependent dehydrogenase (short-subunit alcohol dehydrogenase family)
MPTFVITGARGGIGLGYTRHLAQDSANTVVALVRDAKSDLTDLVSVARSSNAKFHILECDTSSDASVSRLKEEITSVLGPDGKIDTVINNAAIQKSQKQDSLSLDADTLATHININVMGPARILQALQPLLADGAKIANITSGVGSLTMLSDGRINANITPYSISKAALNMLTVHQAQHLKGKFIFVCVDPGHVKTKMGGPNAVVEIADSVSGVLNVLSNLKAEDSGKFFLYTGETLPW